MAAEPETMTATAASAATPTDDTEPPHTTWIDRPRIVALRRRSRFADLTFETIHGFSEHRTGRSAALLGHYAFLSVFPLVLVLTTVLGFVLQGNPSLRTDIVDSALAQLPIVGSEIRENPTGLQGSVIVLVLGLLTSLWSGMRAFVSLQTSLDDIADQPRRLRPNLAVSRLRALTGIGIVGGAQLLTAFLTALIGATDFPIVSKAFIGLAAIVVNATVLGSSFRFLCSKRPSWRSVVPGAILGGIVFAILQFLGTSVVSRAIQKASPIYGTFASVIGLIGWLSLHATVALVCAEVNRALAVIRPERAPATAPAEIG